MPRYFIHMAYDGTAYHGWQVQPGSITVQEMIQHALSTLLRREISVTGAGRTDTGVHASFFMAHFDLPPQEDDPAGTKGNIPPDPEDPSIAADSPAPGPTKQFDPADEQFVFRLNRFLPEDIVVYRIHEVPGDMHARFSATYRTYHYHISTVKPLFTRRYSHYLYGRLDLEAIAQCCDMILKANDFTSFSKLHTDVKTNNCNVTVARWERQDSGYLFEIRADRFLRNMVRSLAGTLIDVGQGKLTPGDFRDILEARDRSRAGQSAPAAGLFLVDIGYPRPADRHGTPRIRPMS